jgi:hypothetical protein
MIQGENKQWYYDEAHADAIEKEFAAKKRKRLALNNMRDYMANKNLMEKQQKMTNDAVTKLEKEAFSKTQQAEANRQKQLNLERQYQKDKLKAGRQKIVNRNANVKHNEEIARLKNPNLYRVKDFASNAYQKQGPQVASSVGGGIASVLGGVKRFITSAARQQATMTRKQEAQVNKQRREYIKFQQKMALARQKNMYVQQRQQQVRQSRMQRPYQMSRQEQQRIYNQQITQRQAEARAMEKKKLIAMTPGFYNPKAEQVNPFGLASRYRINFGQNVFSNLDPENQKVFNNGKYKWRAD